MKKGFVRNIFCSLALGAVAFNAQADLYEDGLMAYAVGDYVEAGQLLMGAADSGNEGAEHMLMRLFSEGKLHAKDLNKETLKWTQKAAEKGVLQAQHALGGIYARQGDAKSALAWYRKAAEQGHPDAFYQLGAILEEGAVNVSADADESERMYSIAASEFVIYAQKGDAEVQYKLADMYRLAQGVEKNMGEALKWMEKSALQGHALAQLGLGRLYALGDDVPRDVRLATYWLELAAAQGMHDATIMLSELGDGGEDKVALLM